jgi:hypothetical protein
MSQTIDLKQLYNLQNIDISAFSVEEKFSILDFVNSLKNDDFYVLSDLENKLLSEAEKSIEAGKVFSLKEVFPEFA